MIKKIAKKKTIIIPSEFDIQVALREWMSAQHPTILMRCSLSGVRVSMGYAVKLKKLNPTGRAWPDIFLPEPRGKHHGLFVELKRCRADLYTMDGGYRKILHIEEQRHLLHFLRQKGYSACFACGFDSAKQVIDDYLDRRG